MAESFLFSSLSFISVLANFGRCVLCSASVVSSCGFTCVLYIPTPQKQKNTREEERREPPARSVGRLDALRLPPRRLLFLARPARPVLVPCVPPACADCDAVPPLRLPPRHRRALRLSLPPLSFSRHRWMAAQSPACLAPRGSHPRRGGR